MESKLIDPARIGNSKAGQLKFAIGTVEDYEWAKEQIAKHELAGKCPLLFSWVSPLTREQQGKSLKAVPPENCSNGSSRA